MREPLVIARFERRLAELGCPSAHLFTSVRELGEHREDLRLDALDEGLCAAEADGRADALLGDPADLAARVAAVFRHSTWWGRHPFIGFCLLPLALVLLAGVLGLSLDAAAGWLYFTRQGICCLAGDAAASALLRAGILGTWFALFLLTSSVLCLLAERAGCGLRWALAACAACSFYSYCLGFKLTSHECSFYCQFPPAPANLHWIPACAPLLAAIGAAWRRLERLRRFRVQRSPTRSEPGRRPAPGLPRTGLVNPSSVVAGLVVAILTVLGVQAHSTWSRRAARERELTEKTWPAERAATMRRLQARQAQNEAPGATTIALQPWVNAALADSLGGAADTTGNHLAELPCGRHIYGGVPFEVAGRIQLLGRKLLDLNPAFPAGVRRIPIAKPCRRLHLLHGASGVTADLTGTSIARLILHYADGSQAQIPVVVGKDVLDWWGPIYQTEVGVQASNPSAAGSELAWAGSNPRLKDQQPEASLRLYKTTFENPRPGAQITAMDYVSAVTDAAPFLVGLTVE